jgi:guanine nucleotide exchange factor VAV
MAAPLSPEEWRQCAEWMVRCSVLPPGHRSVTPDGEVFDLAHNLRDGVILCHLVNNLFPGCINSISQRPQMSPFLCLSNTKLFLHSLQHDFGFTSDLDLFDPIDLYELSQFRRVVNTLSKLSKTSIALQTTHGFPPESSSASFQVFQRITTI